MTLLLINIIVNTVCEHSQNSAAGLYELMFWFISKENSGKQKSKSTLRVEINFLIAKAIH